MVGLRDKLAQISLSVASKSGVACSCWALAQEFVADFAKQGMKVKALASGADLGLDQQLGKRAPRPKHTIYASVPATATGPASDHVA